MNNTALMSRNAAALRCAKHQHTHGLWKEHHTNFTEMEAGNVKDSIDGDEK